MTSVRRTIVHTDGDDEDAPPSPTSTIKSYAAGVSYEDYNQYDQDIADDNSDDYSHASGIQTVARANSFEDKRDKPSLSIEEVKERLERYPDVRECFLRVCDLMERWIYVHWKKKKNEREAAEPERAQSSGNDENTMLIKPEHTEALQNIVDRFDLTKGEDSGVLVMHEDQERRGRDLLVRLDDAEALMSTFRQVWDQSDATHDRSFQDVRVWLKDEMERLTKVIYYARFAHFSLLEAVTASYGLPFMTHSLGGEQLFHDVFKCSSSLKRIKDDRMKLVLYMLEQFKMRRFKKKVDSDYVYEEVVFTVKRQGKEDKKVCSHCYHPTQTIEAMVYKLVTKETRDDLFEAIIRGNIVHDVVNFLTKGTFDEFPFMKVLPRCFSFQDGIYRVDDDLFVEYDRVHKAIPDLNAGYATYKFFNVPFAPAYYYQVGNKRLRAASVSEEEVDVVISGSPAPSPRVGPMGADGLPEDCALAPPPEDAKRPWYSIENKDFEKIAKSQKWSQETINLMYATLGRTLYPAGEMDNAQYVPVHIGESGTGKSTFLKVWMEFFHFPDVMIFGPNQEKMFAREKIVTSRIFLAPDMRGESFGITPEFFLVLASSDPCLFPVKHGKPVYVESVNTPGILATNELPPGFRQDVRGSIHRRLLPFGYTEVLDQRDPNLGARIKANEMPGILRKASQAYLDPKVHPRDIDIMTDHKFPPDIQLERNKLECASNSLVDFLMSPDVKLDIEARTPERQFIGAYQDYCKVVRQQRPCSWNEDFYMRPLRNVGAHVGNEDNERVVFGCQIMRREQDDDEQEAFA